MNPAATLPGLNVHVNEGSGALNEGRGVNPGDTCQRRFISFGPGRPLNEGRGVNPGDTFQLPDPALTEHPPARSTKAGA